MNKDVWLKQGEKILSDVQEWRKAHPKATFVEIEEVVHRGMILLEAQVLQDAAQASDAREWGRETQGERPKCPKCQVP